VPNTDLSKLAAIGYCFGGMVVLEMARDGQNDLAGVVTFHGVLATPMPLRPDTYKGKILVLHGADDPVVPDDQTLSFWKEMREAKAFGSSSPTVKRYTPSPTGSCRKTARRRPPTTSRPIDAPGSPCRISLRRFLRETALHSSLPSCRWPNYRIAPLTAVIVLLTPGAQQLGPLDSAFYRIVAIVQNRNAREK
jgi:hypothetical protein